jgi:TonB-linked SusC/RagA family outer membrane protein
MRTSLGAVLTLLLLLPLIPVQTGAAESRKQQSDALLQQQGRRITGTVKDVQGETIAGASIVEKGTTNGTATDSDGRFTLTLTKENATLQINYVGYKSLEINSTEGGKPLEITLLEDTQALEEVVVIGYGTVRKSDLTGAISQIDPTKKVEKLTSNATDLLRNSVAGLYIPFSTSAKGNVNMGDALIRGTTSLKASNAPLIVLDGVIFEGDLADISSGDIERIDVMKDASSSAIFGSRSANGVINITTKRGTVGAPTINVNMNMGFSTPSFIRPVLSPEGYVDMRQTLLQYTAPRNNQPGYYSNPNNLPSGVNMDQWMAYSNASGDPTNIWLTRLALQDVEIANYMAGRSVDWADQVFQTGLRQDYLASITGGTDKIQYYWSLNYSDNEGFVVGQEYSSFRSRLNLESKIAGFLTVGLNVQYANRDESGIAADWSAYSQLSPYGSIHNDDGSLKYTPHNDPVIINPLIDRAYNENYNKSNDLNSKMYALVTLPFGITYQFNAINNFTQNRTYRHTSASHPGNATNGSASRSNADSWLWNIENIVKWNRTFDVHNFDLTLLSNAEKFQYFSNSQSNTQFDPSDILGYHNMSAGSVPVISSNDYIRTRDALLARLNYTLNGKYLLTSSIRRDGYSAFGQDNPHAFFPSLALAWRLSDESFFNLKRVDNLKIRASWGANGNSAIGEYDALAALSGSKHLYASESGAAYTVSRLVINRMANAELQWEKTTAFNAGLDFSLFKYRLNGTIEGYLSKTTNLLVDRSLPNVTGYDRIASNLGQVNNAGIEIALNSVNMDIPGKFNWQTAFIASYNKNKIVHLYGDMVDIYDDNGNKIGVKESDDYNNHWFIGHAIEEIWDYKPNGVWQAEDAEIANKAGGYLPGEYRMVDVNGDGIYTEIADKQFLGYSKPQFRWNMMNDFTLFRNFSVSFSLYGQHGWKKNYTEKFGNERESDYVIPYWTEENRSNKWTRMSNRDADPKPQSNYINMDFVRLSDISIGYQFPARLTEGFQIQTLKIYGSIQNVAVWSRWPGWDPENTGGPSPRYFNFGINVKL